MNEQSDKVKAFLAELIEVSRKHGLVLGHEDAHGGFEVYARVEGPADAQMEAWLLAASDET